MEHLKAWMTSFLIAAQFGPMYASHYREFIRDLESLDKAGQLKQGALWN